MTSAPHERYSVRFGQGRELRPLHAHVGAAAVHARADLLGAVGGQLSRARSQTGCAKPTWATMPLPKNVPMRLNVRSMN